MRKFLLSIASISSGFVMASILSVSLPLQTIASDQCADDCQVMCGDPGNVVCIGFACETGTITCTKADGEPGPELPGTDL